MEHVPPLLAGDGQPFTAFRATPLQNQPALLGAHTDEKSMRTLAAARVRLKRAFTFHETS